MFSVTFPPHCRMECFSYSSPYHHQGAAIATVNDHTTDRVITTKQIETPPILSAVVDGFFDEPDLPRKGSKDKGKKNSPKIPGKNQLPNFRLRYRDPAIPGGGRDLAIFSSYGDEEISRNLSEKIFLPVREHSFLAVDLISGGCFFASVVWSNDCAPLEPNIDLAIHPIHTRSSRGEHMYNPLFNVPKSYSETIAQALTFKRPYRFEIGRDALIDFAERNIGYYALADELQLRLFLPVDRQAKPIVREVLHRDRERSLRLLQGGVAIDESHTIWTPR